MQCKKTWLVWLLLFLPGLLTCQQITSPTGSSTLQNNPETLQKPYLLLISLDGFRWDYVERFKPANITRFIEKGVQAASMIPSFPSKTFPNHYTIATGMYPDHHGLVDNSFFDYNKNASYSIGNRESVEDGTWYGGTPIWVQAAKSGMVTASFFFVGSEADVQGARPTYYYRYDGAISNEQRVLQVIEWLQLPENQRPHLITLYFSDMDDVGHRQSPVADDKLRDALKKLDDTLGKLFDGITSTHLPVNIIIVSDHGMAPIEAQNLMASEQLEDDDRYRTISSGALAHLYLKEKADVETVYQDLKKKEKNFRVFRTPEVPFFETRPSNPRWGELIVTADPGYYFVNSRVMGLRKASGSSVFGEHGFDPELPDMHGIFYANGPAFREGMKIPSFKNIHVYPLMCKILGLELPAEIDGKAEVLQGVLK